MTLNTADFATIGTSAAMSILLKATSISGGVAIVDNKNEANVNVRGNLIAGKQDESGNLTEAADITLRSNLIQNLSEDSLGKLSAMSVSGSVAGYDSWLSIGGAVSTVKSKGKTTVAVSDGKSGNVRIIAGRNIDIQAIDPGEVTT